MNTLDSVFDSVLAASLRAGVLTLIVLLLQVSLRRHLSARVRHALWIPVLAVLLFTSLPESSWSAENLWAKTTAAVSATRDGPMTRSDLGIPVYLSRSPELEKAGMHWLTMIWAAGAVLFLGTAALSYAMSLRRFRRAAVAGSEILVSDVVRLSREAGLRHPPRLIVSNEVRSPAVAGLLRPVLLLPASFPQPFSARQAELILLHELTHLRRKDLLLNAALCLLMAVHWFNPLLWLAFFRARLDREAACDEQVLQRADSDSRREYGHALIEAASVYSPSSLSLGFVGILQNGSALRSRIRDIATPPRAHPLFHGLAFLAIGLILAVGATQAQSPAATPAKPAQSTAPMTLEQKLTDIVLPSVNFRDTSFNDAIDFLQTASRDRRWNPSGQGVNVVYPLGRNTTRMTLSLKEVPLGEAIRYTASLAGLEVQVKDNSVVLVPESAAAAAAKLAPRPEKTYAAATLAKTLIIPNIDFQDATLAEAMDFFQAKARAFDPSGTKLNVVYLQKQPNAPKVTLKLTNVSLWEAMQHMERVTHWSVRASDGLIFLLPGPNPATVK